jgi:hypothetical protein
VFYWIARSPPSRGHVSRAMTTRQARYFNAVGIVRSRPEHRPLSLSGAAQFKQRDLIAAASTSCLASPKHSAQNSRADPIARSCHSPSRGRSCPIAWIGRFRPIAATSRPHRGNSVVRRDRQPVRPFVRSGRLSPDTSLRYDTTRPCGAPSRIRRCRPSSKELMRWTVALVLDATMTENGGLVGDCARRLTA